MMIAFVTLNSSLVTLTEGLPWEFEFSGFRRNRTDDLGINTSLLGPTEPRLHVRFMCPHNNRTLCPLSYKPVEHRQIESGPTMIISKVLGSVSG